MRTRHTLVGLLFLILSVSAGAAEPVTLRQAVIVDDPLIRLGDIFDISDPAKASKAVAYAPRPGRRVAFDVDWLYRIARQNRIAWRPRSRFDRVVVERASQVVDRPTIEAAISAELVARGAPARHELGLDNPAVRLHLAPDVRPEIVVRELWYDAASRRFSALVAAAEDRSAAPMRVAGRLYEVVDVPVPARPIAKGEVIGRDDVKIVTMRADRLSRGAVTDIDEIVGKAPRRSLRAGEPVRPGDVRRPVVVAKGSTVTMVYRTPFMELTARGRAIEDGGHGDVIKVMNTQSKKVIEAVVADADTVLVGATGPAAVRTARRAGG